MYNARHAREQPAIRSALQYKDRFRNAARFKTAPPGRQNAALTGFFKRRDDRPRQSLRIAPGDAAEADENRRRARRQKSGEIARRRPLRIVGQRPVTVDMSMVRPVVRMRNDMAAEAVQDRYRSPLCIAYRPHAFRRF